MTSDRSMLAITIAVTATLVAGVLVYDRSGVIAWLIVVLGALLLAKIWLKPSARDLGLAIGLSALFAISWFGVQQYVISTWESGEVVELEVDTERGKHSVRLWVMDIGAAPTVYYDAEPSAARSLLAGKPVRLTRAGESSLRTPIARQVETLTEQETNDVLEAMESKYGERNGAADVYYLMLGRSRDRVALVVELREM